jgi:hypothetical protein
VRPLVALTLVLVTVLAAPARAQQAPLTLGMQDPLAFQGELQGDALGLALTRTRETGASVVRLGVSWRHYQRRKPKRRADARNHTWSGYDWTQLDQEVRAIVGAGLEPFLAIGDAPSWFEGGGRPRKARPGTWRPSATGFGDFGRAVSLRYSGTGRDAAGNPLPRVRYYQAWNEPNLSAHLSPQASRGRVVSIDHYLRMLRAFYAEVKRTAKSNFVVTGGLGPFGRLPISRSNAQLSPVDFTRAFLCVNENGTRARRCRRVPFDAFALNAYPQDDPRDRPNVPADIRIRLHEITSALNLAARARTISSRQAGRIWITELGFVGTRDGRDDDPSLTTQATWLQMALFMLWRDRVDAVIYWNLRDRPEPVFMQRSGLFERGDSIETDRAKPAYTAFRFPLLFTRSGRQVNVWGRAPSPGTVAIEKEVDGGFEEIASVTVGAERVFQVLAPSPGDARLRLRQGSDTSLPMEVTSPAP